MRLRAAPVGGITARWAASQVFRWPNLAAPIRLLLSSIIQPKCCQPVAAARLTRSVWRIRSSPNWRQPARCRPISRRYADAVVALSKAFASAAASDAARTIRDEVGFFQAIRAALIKNITGDGKRSAADRELAIQQIVSRAVVSAEIVDIMKAAGLASPDISILSDEFLAEVRDTDKKNLAIEALKKLINRRRAFPIQTQRHPVSRAFSERLEAAISRYHANAITTAQVLEELIQLAKDIRAARARSEATGLTDEEIARQVMGEPALRVIAYRVGKEHQEQRLGGLDYPPTGGAGPRRSFPHRVRMVLPFAGQLRAAISRLVSMLLHPFATHLRA